MTSDAKRLDNINKEVISMKESWLLVRVIIKIIFSMNEKKKRTMTKYTFIKSFTFELKSSHEL